jgi:hypothetical protein
VEAERDARERAEHLIVRIVEYADYWPFDPLGCAAALNLLLRTATPATIMLVERGYRARRRSVVTLIEEEAFEDGGLAAYFSDASAIAALMSMDRSGYVREHGVRELARGGEAFTLPFLLLRVADPVVPVRELAVAAVRDRLDAGNVASLVPLLPLVEGLDRRRRVGATARGIGDLLLHGAPGGRAALWAGVRGAGGVADPAVRASCLRLLAQVDPLGAVEGAMATGDPRLRHWAAGVATAPSLDPAHADRLLPLLERDANPRTRWRALRARARRPDALPHLRRALLDPDARVRYLARAGLRARGHPVTVAVYRAALAPAAPGPDPGTLVGALAGLSDMGGPGDVPLVLPYLDHARVRVRSEAWRALAVLDAEAFAARLERLRRDPSGKVRRQLPASRPEK